MIKLKIFQHLLLLSIQCICISCYSDYSKVYNKYIYCRSCNIKVDTVFTSLSHNKESAFLGTNSLNKREKVYFSFIDEVVINIKKGDILIKNKNSGLFQIIKSNNDTLIYNYELKNKFIYCNGNQEYP